MLKLEAFGVAMDDAATATAEQLRAVYAHTRSLRDLISASDDRILPGNLESMLQVIQTMQARIETLFVGENLGA